MRYSIPKFLLLRCSLLSAGFVLWGCDKNNSALPPENETKNTTVDHQNINHPEVRTFPNTENEPINLSWSRKYERSSDQDLMQAFQMEIGVNWNLALNEMVKRRTPQLISQLVHQIDLARGLAKFGGEAYFAPELSFPVVQKLMEIGDAAVMPLVDLVSDPNMDLKKRVLAIKTLRLIKNGVKLALDYLKDDPSRMKEFKTLDNYSTNNDAVYKLLGSENEIAR
jgi:hypothetical protein